MIFGPEGYIDYHNGWLRIGRRWFGVHRGKLFVLPVIAGGTSANTVQNDKYAFGDDDGSESGHSLDTENTPRTAQVPDVTFMFRVQIEETAGKNDPWAFQLYYYKNGGATAYPVTSSDAQADGILKANDTQSRSDGEATTERLSYGGSGSWLAGEYDDGTSSEGTGTIGLNGNYTDIEFAIQGDSTNLSDGDYFDFEVRSTSGGTLDGYPSTLPRVTFSVETLTQVNKDIQAVWDIDVLVNKDTQLLWDIDVLVNKDIQSVWDIDVLVNKDTQAVWDILNLVNKDIEAVWDMSGVVYKDHQMLWDIDVLVNKDLEAQWDMLAEVNKDIQMLWDMTELVNKDLQAIWDMEGVVSKDLQAVWDLLNLVNKDIAAEYDILNLVNKDTQMLWDIDNLVNKDIQAVWDMSGIVNRDIAVQYDILNLVNKDNQMLWDILVLVNKDLQLDWDILNAVYKDIEAVWDIEQGAGIVNKDIQVIYDILGIYAAAKRAKTAFPFWF